MKASLIWILLLNLLFLTACKTEESKSDAKDYMPFTYGGYLFHWNKGSTLRIYLPTDVSADADTIGYETRYRTAFLAGISKWDSTLLNMGVTKNYSGTATNNDIKIEWDDGNGVDIGVLGKAVIELSENTSRKIVMTTQKNYQGFASHSDAEITAIAAHEFGHMLGIWSHSFDIADLMYPLAEGLTEPSNRDQKTMEYLYGFTPDVNLSDLPVNTALSELNDSAPQTGFFIRAQCGPDQKMYGYQEFEFSSPDGISPLNPDLN